MNLKGKVSSINTSANTAEVILLEYDGVVTAPIPFYHAGAALSATVGQFVIVAVFGSGDFNDGVIL